MVYDPHPPERFGWGAILGVFALSAILGVAALTTTIGSRANVTFQNVGNSLSTGSLGSYTYSPSPRTNSPVAARTPFPPPDFPSAVPDPLSPAPESPAETASFQRVYENEFLTASDHPLSTFSVDVDTASYSLTRRFLREGRSPPPDAVRVADFINYFTYDYPPPTGEHPVSITADVAACPWKHRTIAWCASACAAGVSPSRSDAAAQSRLPCRYLRVDECPQPLAARQVRLKAADRPA